MKDALRALAKIGIKVCPFNKCYEIADASGKTIRMCATSQEVIVFAATQTIF